MAKLHFGALVLGLILLLSAAKANPCGAPALVVAGIRIKGAEVTKDRILIRELTFAVGDSIAPAALEPLLQENQKRLLNLRLFHFVRYSYTCDQGRVEVEFQVQERFYLYPFPILDFADRNFNAWLEKRDWDRIDYGLNVLRRNFRGRNEDVRVKVQRGFNQKLELVYRAPYLSQKQQLGIDFGIYDYRSHTITYANRQNKQAFYVQEEGLPIKRTSVAAALVHRRSVQRQEVFTIAYSTERISDSVASLNPDYYLNSFTDRKYLRLDLSKVINLRNNFVYPLTGRYFDASVGHTLFLRNSGAAYTTLRAKFVDYEKLSSKWYYAVGAEGQVRLSGQHAFADNTALGYRSLVRGYELYVVGGQHYGLFKQGLSREVLNITGIKLNFISNPKFNTIPLAVYLNGFTDAGYVVDRKYEKHNPLTNRLLLGTGLGLHLVTFYDVVLRLEYAINREGDKGFYFGGRFPF